jgi:DNA processing protein
MSVYNAISKQEQIDTKEMTEAIKRVKCEYLTIVDVNYPEYFRIINKPPFVLFYTGDITNFSKNIISVCGKLNRINVQYLKILNELGYTFIYALNNENISDIKKMLMLNFKINIYVPSGMNNQYVKKIFCYMRDHTLIFSDLYENSDMPEQIRILLGNNNKVLFIDYENYESIKNMLNYCHTEKNSIYQIIYNNATLFNEN